MAYFQAKEMNSFNLHLILLPCSHIIILTDSSSAKYLHVSYCVAMSRPLLKPISSVSDMWKALCSSNVKHHLSNSKTRHPLFSQVNLQHDEKSKWTCIFKMRRCVFALLFFFLYISTSLLSIHHDLSAGLLSHLLQILALLQKRIDPIVNLISMILCRAFSFTALHNAKQTWLFHAVVYQFETEILTQLR